MSTKKPLSYLTQARIERQLSTLLDTKVDLVIENTLREDLAPTIYKEALPL